MVTVTHSAGSNQSITSFELKTNQVFQKPEQLLEMFVTVHEVLTEFRASLVVHLHRGNAKELAYNAI